MKLFHKISVLLLSALFFVPSLARADEGMWLLSLIGKNYTEMKNEGFKLTPEDIYSINRSCLKDAVVGLGREGNIRHHFCTGEIISNQGLVSTNHHCGYDYLQKHSTLVHDYLRDGFWAYSLNEELPNPGLTAAILVRIEDVTDRVSAELSDQMSLDDRQAAIDAIGEKLAAKAVRGTRYNAHVASVFGGNQFFLFVYNIYHDVRLVGAPPSSMGNFGGDTDNWMWPRHTCDFSLFRIYSAPDGSPAAFSNDNVPLKPKHHLPVSIKGVQQGDFAMVLGYPGSTNRFATSYEVDDIMKLSNALSHDIQDVKIKILREEIAASHLTRIKYSSKYQNTSNGWKYAYEQNKALAKLGTKNLKVEQERQYLDWARRQGPKYSNALSQVESAIEARRPYRTALFYIYYGLMRNPELFMEAYALGQALNEAFAINDYAERVAAIDEIREEAAQFYKDYEPAVECRVMAASMSYVYANMEKTYCPDFLEEAASKAKRSSGGYNTVVRELFANSYFASEEAFNTLLDNPSFRSIKNDPMYQAGAQLYDMYHYLQKKVKEVSSDNFATGMRYYVDGLMRINAGATNIAPDANSTPRCTYGNVLAYEPADGVFFNFYTTLDGVMQKEDPSNSEFIVPERLKQLYRERNYGVYANADGKLPTCFITNNDITGGNSGSPVINGQGQLIGLAFDGNSEAMSGDIDFEETLQRCICLDARYMLWVIDKFANAQNLIEEIDIVR